MANPQKENGYTVIANEILDHLCKFPIKTEARRVFDFILRKTWGYNKKSDHIPLSQFVEGTGLKKPNVCRALKEALSTVIILKDENGYRINKDYIQWVDSSVINRDNKIINRDNLPLSLVIPSKENSSKEIISTTHQTKFFHSLPEGLGLETLTRVTQGCGLEHSIPPMMLKSLAASRHEADLEQAIMKACSWLLEQKKKTLTYSTLLKFLNDYPIKNAPNSSKILEAEISRKVGHDTSAPKISPEEHERMLTLRRQKLLTNINTNATSEREINQSS